ncbi:hypothetical protein QBZ16_002027 [Prototheca wickerhamii]|uniref:KOW domain-containing protein n=1 Tax=Prototheca wickerhamii TaxID=3111 RepID=A0AAD9INZ6_PROWI|nr:hypothetical protein QBZ16_002027 [Prototheca wickerhamii]
MHVKTGDLVQVRSGSDKGKVGRVQRVLRKVGQIVVDGINFKSKHVKPEREGEQGTVTVKEYPVHHSNVAHYSVTHGVASRIGVRFTEDGKKVRYLKKTGETLEN